MRRAPQDQSARPDRGISLIELVLAMAIFALVAVLGAQALTGMLRMRDDLVIRSDQSAALAELTSLLRADLAALVPMLFYPPDRAAPRSALRFEPAGPSAKLSLSRAGLSRFDSEAAASTASLQPIRVEWLLHQGQLSRRVWPSLFPARADARSAPVPWPSAERDRGFGPIEALRLRSYWPQIGWVEGAHSRASANATPTAAGDSDSTAVASEVYSNSLPLAVELTLVTRDHGEISLVESLK